MSRCCSWPRPPRFWRRPNGRRRRPALGDTRVVNEHTSWLTERSWVVLVPAPQVWPDLGRTWAKFWPNWWPRVGRFRAKFGPVGGRQVGQLRPKSGKQRSSSGQAWAVPARIRPMSSRISPRAGNIFSISGKVWPNSKTGRNRPNRNKKRTHVAPLIRHRPFRPNSTRIRQNRGGFDRMWPSGNRRAPFPSDIPQQDGRPGPGRRSQRGSPIGRGPRAARELAPRRVKHGKNGEGTMKAK